MKSLSQKYQPKEVRPLTHTEILYRYLLDGHRIEDHRGWELIRVPNIRSRVCSVEKKYGVKVSRERVPGKNHNVYWIENTAKATKNDIDPHDNSGEFAYHTAVYGL